MELAPTGEWSSVRQRRTEETLTLIPSLSTSSLPHARRFHLDTGVRALAQELVKIEEAKLAKQKKQMGGFLKGKTLGEGEGQAAVVEEISTAER